MSNSNIMRSATAALFDVLSSNLNKGVVESLKTTKENTNASVPEMVS